MTTLILAAAILLMPLPGFLPVAYLSQERQAPGRRR